MNKKFIALVLCLGMALSVSACSHEHSYGEWTTDKAATCVEAGEKSRICKCGEKETAAIEPTGHQFDEGEILEPATCVSDGTIEKKCSVCGATETETLPAGDPVMSTDYVNIDGIYINDSYENKNHEGKKLVYVFATVHTSKENLSFSSVGSVIKINDVNEYISDHYHKTCLNAPNYYYGAYIKDVNVGDELKIVYTFMIPEGELAPDRVVTISLSNIPDSYKLAMCTNEFIKKDNIEEIAKEVDPEGAEEYAVATSKADSETTKKVQKELNGYYFEFYVPAGKTALKYNLEFSKPNKFTIKTSGLKNSGTYTVENGYIALSYDGKTTAVRIPWTMDDGEFKANPAKAFDIYQD